MNEQPTHLDLFSGIGGFALAAQWAGFKTIGFSEINPFCCCILQHRFPGIPNYGDVKNVPAIHTDLLTAGFPCQPISCAGRRLGERDDRYLWPSVLAAIDRCKPDWFLGENVVNIKNMVLSRCLDDLEKRGYQRATFDIPSCAVGLPTMERHVWIVAASIKSRLERMRQMGTQWEIGRALHGWQDDNGAEKESKRPSLPTPQLLRSRKGIANYVDRITAIGNAIPPPIACEILKVIWALSKPSLAGVQPTPGDRRHHPEDHAGRETARDSALVNCAT